ncbi:cilia- and flagella-associated protein 100 [Rhinophrynus dorsalis]
MSSLSQERSAGSRETTVSGVGSRAPLTISHLSAHRSILNSAKTDADTKSAGSARVKKKNNVEQNPFKIPPDVDFFLIRDQEKEKKQKEKERNKNLKVHQKTTYTAKMKAKLAGLRKEIEDEEEEESEEGGDKTVHVPENLSWKLAITRERLAQKESLHEYIKKKKEMFLLQYSLGVKRDEIQKLEALASAEEMKLEKAEQYLEEDAVRFDEFLKQNDRNSVEALKLADKETKLKMDKVAQIKSQTAQMMTIKSDISKCEETLREYLMYKEFLYKLSPKEWKEEVERKRRERKKLVIPREKESKLALSPDLVKRSERRLSELAIQGRDSARDLRRYSRQSIKAVGVKKMSNATFVEEDKDIAESLVSSDSEEEAELYFTDPQQLLDIFSELEEQNLSLIQNSQETEETLEEIKHTIAITQEKMEKETQQLKEHIDQLNTAIAQEKERAADLELKSRVFAFGQYKSEDQEKMLASLSKKVEEVYRACIGENRSNLSALQMLMIIERQLEELLDNIELIPQKRMEIAEKAKEKERRLRLREEKIKQQKLHQEERLRKALERAQADPKKTTGRKLMPRSDPPALKPKIDKDQDKIDKEKEEALLFFT